MGGPLNTIAAAAAAWGSAERGGFAGEAVGLGAGLLVPFPMPLLPLLPLLPAEQRARVCRPAKRVNAPRKRWCDGYRPHRPMLLPEGSTARQPDIRRRQVAVMAPPAGSQLIGSLARTNLTTTRAKTQKPSQCDTPASGARVQHRKAQRATSRKQVLVPSY
jgi:hypothetical protein